MGGAILAFFKSLPELVSVAKEIVHQIKGLQKSFEHERTERIKREMAKEIVLLQRNPNRHEISQIIERLNRINSDF